VDGGEKNPSDIWCEAGAEWTAGMLSLSMPALQPLHTALSTCSRHTVKNV